MCLFLCWLTTDIKVHLIVGIALCAWICLNLLQIICLDSCSLLLYIFVDVKKEERQMNLSIGRNFLFDINAYIEGDHIMLIDIICICISLGGVFLIHLIGVLSSSKKGRLISSYLRSRLSYELSFSSLCLILMIPKHLCCYF